jgi:protein-disulfide isomerase
MSKPEPSKNDRRAAARERARVARAQQQRRARVRRWSIQGGIGVVIVAAAVAVVLIVTQSGSTPVGPGPRNMASGGVLMTGDGTSISTTTTPRVKASALVPTSKPSSDVSVQVVIYEDLQCPICKEFETANIDYLQNLVRSGKATLEIHPISILDRASLGTKYSTRAANAMACVVDARPNKFLAVNRAMYAKQPTEGTKGLSNAQIASIVKKAGVGDASVAKCIDDGTYSDWITDVSTQATTKKIPNSSLANLTGTPTVLVNGKQYKGSLNDPTAFQAFVDEQSTK